MTSKFMNNVDLNIKVLLTKPTPKQLIRTNQAKLFAHKLGFCVQRQGEHTQKSNLFTNWVFDTRTDYLSPRNRVPSLSAFHQTSVLQSKNRVSGEISKEPFLDILLTNLEQSSFSLIREARAVENEYKPRKERASVALKISNYLFSRNELALENKSFVRFMYQNSGFGMPGTTKLKSFDILSSSSKSCLVKPFFVLLEPGFSMKRTRNTDNLNWIWGYTLLKPSFYLRYAKVYTPSRSGGKNSEQLQILRVTDPKFVRLESRLYSELSSTRDFPHESRYMSCLLKIGDYVNCGDKIGSLSETPVVITESGKIVKISKTQITVQKMQPVLFYSQAEIHVESNEWVKRGTPLLTLTHQTLVTGDIVQGIPRIEQLFEASTAPPPGAALQDFGTPDSDDSSKKSSIDDYLRLYNTSRLLPPNSGSMGAHYQGVSPQDSKGTPQNKQNTYQINEHSSEKRYDSTVHSGTEENPMFLYKTLQSQVRETFRKKLDQVPLPVAVRQSLEEIQQIIVESIQKVYISQGVLIADKHIEIIVRQMTSKAQVFDGGSTGLLIDEIMSLQQIENANLSTPGQKALYLPVVMGLTRSALSSDSFVSAASFQETTRVLSRDAIAGKTDFLRGLKEKVIIGDLIEAGTGLDAFYTYSLFSKTLFSNKFRDILNRKVYHKTLKKLVLTVPKPEQSNA